MKIRAIPFGYKYYVGQIIVDETAACIVKEIFSQYVGAAAVFSYENGTVEILRVNQKYIRELGINTSEESIVRANPWSHQSEDSKRLYEDYGNGKEYYKYKGQKLLILPEKTIELPSKEYLAWHNENVFLA